MAEGDSKTGEVVAEADNPDVQATEAKAGTPLSLGDVKPLDVSVAMAKLEQAAVSQSPNQPQITRTFDVPTAMDVLERAKVFEETASVQAAMKDLLSIDAPRTLDEVSLRELAVTLGITKEAVDHVLGSMFLTKEQMREDEKFVDYIDTDTYVKLMQEHVLGTLRAQCPGIEFEVIQHPNYSHNNRLLVQRVNVTKRLKEQGFISGLVQKLRKTPPPMEDAREEIKMAEINILHKECDSFDPIFTRLFGKYLKNGGYKMTRHYRID